MLLPTPGTEAIGIVLLLAAAAWCAWLAWLARADRDLPDGPRQSFDAGASGG
jgi:hypothetical protein